MVNVCSWHKAVSVSTFPHACHTAASASAVCNSLRVQSEREASPTTVVYGIFLLSGKKKQNCTVLMLTRFAFILKL